MTANDALELRYQRMARARELCFQRLRVELGQQLPPRVVSAVNELADTMVRLGVTPDDWLEVTTVSRRPG